MSPRALRASESTATTRPRWRRRKKAAPSELHWVVWPAREHLVRGLGVLVFIVVVSVCVNFAVDSRVYAGLTFFTLIVAVMPFYLPSSYRLDERGLEVDSLLGRRHKPWSALQAYFLDGEKGVLVSPVSKFGLTARTRGFYLPFQNNRDQVMALVEKHLQPGK